MENELSREGESDVISSDPRLWAILISVIMVWSILIKENMLYRIAENLFIAVIAANGVLSSINIVSKMGIGAIQEGQFHMIVPIALGLLLYTNFIKGKQWMARWPTSFLLSVGIGVGVVRTVDTELVRQISMTVVPLVGATPFDTFNNVCLIVMMFSTILYFIFTERPSQYLRPFRSLGRYTIMIAMGAGFGGAVLNYTSMFLENIVTILYDLFGL